MTVYLVPAGTDSAPGASTGDYLLRPTDGDLVEVGRVDDGCTWVGTLSRDLLPALPEVSEPTEGTEQERLLAAAQGVESAEGHRGG
jgi:hypothetical protein